MPTFNKSRGFKLKSGNKANAAFKMMGSSPIQQQADGALVQAAQNAAMANVPKDNSAQYQKAADAANTASKAQTEALTSIIKEAPGMIIAANKGIEKGTAKKKAREADVGFQDAKEQLKQTKIESKEAKKRIKKEGGAISYGTGLDGEKIEVTKKDINKYKKEQKEIKKSERKRVNKKAGEEFEKTWEKEGRSNVSDARKLTGADGSAADKDRDYKNEYDQKKYKDKLKNYDENKGNKKTLKKLQDQLDELGI